MGLTIFKMLILGGITSDIQLEITFKAAFICHCKPKFPTVYQMKIWSKCKVHQHIQLKSGPMELRVYEYDIHNANSWHDMVLACIYI